MSISADRSQILFIDMQDRLFPAMRNGNQAVERAAILAEAAAHIGVPITISEQYPRGLGATVPTLLDACRQRAVVMEKIAFSCLKDETIEARIETLVDEGRDQIIVCGVEAHVCVAQTILALLARKHTVYLVCDAISSRKEQDEMIALRRLEQACTQLVTSEMVIFEWLERAGTTAFKLLSKLIR